MATNKIVHGNEESKWGFVEQGVWDSAGSVDSAMAIFDAPIPTGIDYGIFKDQSLKSGRGRIASSTDTYHTPKGGTVVIPFSDLIVKHAYAGDLLYAVFQGVDEGETPYYEKTFAWNHATTQPDFTTGAASYFCTLGIFDTIAAYCRQFHNCILRTLTLSADMSGGDGRLRASGEFISGAAANTTATFGGVWSHPVQSFFDFNAPTKFSVGSDAVIYSWDLTINNNAIRIGHTTTGTAETYKLGPYEVTGNISVKYDVAMQGIIAAAIAGTATSIQLACGTDGQTGNFDILMTTCQLLDVAKDYGSPEGQKINIPFIAMGVSGDATAAITVTMSDGSDKAWPT